MWVWYMIARNIQVSKGKNDLTTKARREDAGTFGIYKLFWNYLNSCEFDDLPLFLVSEEGVSKRLHEN